jgi:NAD(P)H-dependent FMN reductase
MMSTTPENLQQRIESIMSKPILTIVIGSTRPGRVAPKFAAWFRSRAITHDGFDIELVDLAQLNLPFLDEPSHPRLRQYAHQHTIDWSRIVERSDAFVFVTPEYNFGYSAVLKNAIDYLSQEWADKAVGFVSYGGVAGGTRAVQQLKQVVTALKMIPVAESVNLPFFTQFIDDSGTVRPNDVMTRSADAMLDELARTTGTPLDRVKLTGGGVRNRRWVIAKAALGPGRLEVVRTEEAAALGAALVAGVASGAYGSVEAALAEASPFDRVTAPAGVRARYDAAYLDRWLPATITHLRQSGGG